MARECPQNGWGFQLGLSSKNLFHHKENRVSGLTHGDDFVLTGPTKKLMEFEKEMTSVYPIKAKTISLGSSKSIKTLSRRLHWGKEGIIYQHDPRHIDVLVKDLGLENGNSVQTPATPETVAILAQVATVVQRDSLFVGRSRAVHLACEPVMETIRGDVASSDTIANGQQIQDKEGKPGERDSANTRVPGYVSLDFVGWNAMKQLTVILSLYAAIFVLLDATALPASLLDATASPTCLCAAFFLLVALGGFALLIGPCPVGSCGSCFQFVPWGAAMTLAAMLAATPLAASMLEWGASGFENDFLGIEIAATGVFVMLFAALSVVVSKAQVKAKGQKPRVLLTEEFFADCYKGDTVDLAKLSKHLHVSHDFLAGFVFENGMGGPVEAVYDAAAAVVLDNAKNKLASHAAAACFIEEDQVSAEVTGLFDKLGSSLQEKIQFFVKGVGKTQVTRGFSSQLLSSVLSVPPDSYLCCNGRPLDLGSSIGSLGLLSGCTIWIYPRQRGGAPPSLDIPGQWRCALCNAVRC